MTSRQWRITLGEHLREVLPNHEIVIGAPGYDFITIGDGTESAGSATIYIEAKGTKVSIIRWTEPMPGEMSRGDCHVIHSPPPNSGAGWLTMYAHEVKMWVEANGVTARHAKEKVKR